LSFDPFRAKVEKCCRLRQSNRAVLNESPFVSPLGQIKMRLLIAEDDRALGLFLQHGLEGDGHRVRLVRDGSEAVQVFKAEIPDLTILDLNLPKKDGECALGEMRMFDAEAPVLVLTGRQELETRVRCLERGADDVMLKPFSFVELRARCRILLRRKSDVKMLLRTFDIEINRMDRSVKRSGQSVALTNTEFSFLEQLMLNRGHCVSRSELLHTVWKPESAQATNIVDVYVNYLRRKLHDRPPASVIRTVRGSGYMIPLAMETEARLSAAD
jgi:DNA-binding response OmpR family regulator